MKGFIKPFERYESEDFKQIKAEKYPNNGHVFSWDYELLDFDIKK
jgi:hypothetical protein